MHALLLAYVPFVLVIDDKLASAGAQLGLGLATFAVLVACAGGVQGPARRELWICVPVATLFEIVGSIVWGGYRYRLGNVPAYVPPGHALVYLFGITACTLPVVRDHGRLVNRIVLGLCTAWTAAGLTLLPLLTHRVDAQGAIVWPIFCWCILRSGRGDVFASIWLVTAAIELLGTWAGDWTWGAVAPWTQLPSGNPPSAIAGGYAVIDGSVALLAAGLLRIMRPERGAAATASP